MGGALDCGPSFASSLAIPLRLQVGLSTAMRSTSAMSSAPIGGRPTGLDLQPNIAQSHDDARQ
jgi:hypothetical protein